MCRGWAGGRLGAGGAAGGLAGGMEGGLCVARGQGQRKGKGHGDRWASEGPLIIPPMEGEILEGRQVRHWVEVRVCGETLALWTEGLSISPLGLGVNKLPQKVVVSFPA